MDWIEEFHSVFERIWNEDVHRDCSNRRIRTERDMVASIYHHLRADKWFAQRENTEEDLKITLEKGLDTSRRKADLMVRRNGEWLVVMECKLHVNPDSGGNIQDVLKDLDSLKAAREGGKNGRGPKRAYLCYLLAEKSMRDIVYEDRLDSFECQLLSHRRLEDSYFWAARGIRASKKKEDEGLKFDWNRFKPTWRVLPWGAEGRRLRS